MRRAWDIIPLKVVMLHVYFDTDMRFLKIKAPAPVSLCICRSVFRPPSLWAASVPWANRHTTYNQQMFSMKITAKIKKVFFM